MKLKSTIIWAGLALGAIALAAVGIEGAKGRGIVQNEAGHRAHLRFDVKKVIRGTRITGDFHFVMVNSAAHRGIDIMILRAAAFVRNGNKAQFGGRARAVFLENGRRVVKEGTLHAHVEDRTSPEHPTDLKDLLGLRFAAATGPFVFEFGGKVVEGDLRVYERN